MSLHVDKNDRERTGAGARDRLETEYERVTEACQMNNARSGCTVDCEILLSRTAARNFPANPIILMEC